MWPATSFAYRTASDLEEFKSLTANDNTAPIGWETSDVAFRLKTDALGQLVVEDVARALNVAMSTWNAPICSALSLTLHGVTTQSAQPGDSINTVQLVKDWNARGFGADVGAVTDVQYAERPATEPNGPSRWVIAEADIYLDAENFEWAYEVLDPRDARKSLVSVLAHELGHAAGLLHPCETEHTRDDVGASADPNAPLCADVPGVEASLLHPEYSATQTKLSADERAGVCFLYAQDSCETLGCPKGELCTDRGCVAKCGDVVCAAGEQCFRDECVSLCSGLDCYVGQECKKTSDCPNFLKCRKAGENRSKKNPNSAAKVCLAGDVPLGDPCQSSRDCASSACSEAGFCVPACTRDDQCPGSTTCERTQGSVKGCVGTHLRGFGEPCDEANECLGNQCVSGRSATPVCTRACSFDVESSNSEECPAGSECGLAVSDGKERAVCLPTVEAASCNVAPAASLGAPTPERRVSSSRTSPLLFLIFALAFIVHFTRRRKARASAT